jgi:hypothetical protein
MNARTIPMSKLMKAALVLKATALKENRPDLERLAEHLQRVNGTLVAWNAIAAAGGLRPLFATISSELQGMAELKEISS